MRIIPDLTHTILLTLPFFVTIGGMYFILWRPLNDWMDEREGLEAKAKKETDELQDAARDQLSRIEAHLTESQR
ncbi:MAG: hypothetical protein AAF211_18275, partial [Myxococcota bacterium]